MNEDLIESIRPYTAGGRSAGCLVTMRSGDQICPDASMEEAQRELERVGFLDSQPTALPKLLSEDEETILVRMFAQGFRYIAKDANGATFAYTNPPTKGSVSWLNDDDTSRVAKFSGSIDMLSFEDEYPLDIVVALGLEDE